MSSSSPNRAIVPALAEGSLFGRYRIVKRLGEGAMGAVFLAHDTKLNDRSVALKIPKFTGDDREAELQRFHREAGIAATMSHPNLCPVYDVGEQDGVHFLAMGFIDGKPLNEVLGGKPVAEKQAAMLVRKIALAMQAAHDKGVVHRDLKPANVMLDARKEPVVMDFGLAKQSGGINEAQITQSGMIIGTPAYMSPEQVAGETDHIGPASDVYSLGVILYELLTGVRPFQGPITAVLGQIIAKEPPPPREHRPSLDPKLETIALKAIAKKLETRYASMTAFAAALGDYIKQLSASASQSMAKVEEPLKPAGELSLGSVAALVDAARQCVRAHDYAEAVRLFETIPARHRSAEIETLRKQAASRQDEVDGLQMEIELACEARKYKSLAPKLERMLKLKPGHTEAKKLLERLNTYGGTKAKHRYNDAGELLPAPKADSLFAGIELKYAAMIGVAVVAFMIGSALIYSYLRKPKPEQITAPNPQLTTNAPKTAIAPFDAAQAKRHQEDWAAYLKTPVEFENSIGMKLRLIPPGEFWMGPPAGESGSVEAPKHQVRLTRPFHMGMHEITVSQWRDVMDSAFPGTDRNLPAGGMSWQQAFDFCQKLSDDPKERQAGRRYRLPTEAEWEYCGRAGWEDRQPSNERLWPDGGKPTVGDATAPSPVGSFAPNAFGLFDMDGNLAEYCADWWSVDYYRNSPVENPPGPATGTERIIRVGGTPEHPWRKAVGWRAYQEPIYQDARRGFRVVCELDAVKQALKGIPSSPAGTTTPQFALEFDGNSKVRIDSLTLDLTKPFTVEACVRLTSYGQQFPAVFTSGPPSVWTMNANITGEVWQFQLQGKKSGFLTAAAPVVKNRRIYLAGVFDGKQIAMFADGKLAGNIPLGDDAFIANQTTWVELGALLNGVVDEVRISQVARSFSGSMPPNRLEADADTLALYHFDEGQGDVLNDSSGNKHHGKIVGAKWVRVQDLTPSSQTNFALEFDGKTDNYVEIPTLGSSDFGPLTIEAWANADPASTGHTAVVVLHGPYWVQLNRNTDAWYAIDRGPGTQEVATPRNRWCHLAFVLDETSTAFFVDGRETSRGPRSPASTRHTSKPLATFGSPKFSAFHGMIDEVRISKAVKYRQNFTPERRLERTADTLALYHFDEGQGEVLTDSSGNKHHGKVVGAEWVKIADHSPAAAPIALPVDESGETMTDADAGEDDEESEPVAPPPGHPPSSVVLISPDWRWTEPRRLGKQLNTDGREASVSLTSSERRIFFVRDSVAMISARKLKKHPFGEARAARGPLSEVGQNINSMSVTSDGMLMVLILRNPEDRRPPVQREGAVWMCQRSAMREPFGQLVRLPDVVNADSRMRTSWISHDGLVLVVARPSPDGSDPSDLYQHTRASRNADFGPGMHLGPVANTPNWDYGGTLSPDGLVLFRTTRKGNREEGTQETMMCTRTALNQPFDKLVPLDPVLAAYLPFGIHCSLDGTRIHFHASAKDDGERNMDLFTADRVPKK